jgi:DNA-binding NarL/FixJ family response regulator
MDQGIISIYYNVKDQQEMKELLSHLRMVHPAGSFHLYPDGQGSWEIPTHTTAVSIEIILLIITTNFLKSETTKNHIPALIAQWHRDDRVIFPIIAKGCAWETVPWLHQLMVWPNDGQPIWLSPHSRNDEYLAQVVYEIARTKRQMTTKSIRVIVADDHIHAVEGLRSIIEKTTEMKVIGIAETKLQVLDLIRTTFPDVLILDIAWPGDKEFGLKLIPQVRQYSSHTKIIAITNYPELMEEAQQAGAFPLLKGFSKDLLLDTIRWAISDSSLRPLAQLSSIHKSRTHTMPQNLTDREKEVLLLLVDALTDKQIALKLGIAEGTVKKHVSSILNKLEASSRTEAAIKVERLNSSL